MIMKLSPSLTFSLLMTLAAAGPAFAQEKDQHGVQPPAKTVPSEDGAKPHAAPVVATETEFVNMAAKAGMAEVKAAKLAVKNAKSNEVKNLAEMIVKDHTAANTNLKAAAKKADITITESADPMAEEKYEMLSKLEGDKFDTAFLEGMAKCHAMDIQLFTAGKNVAKSEGVIAFIDETLPVIKGHAAKLEAMRPGKEPAPVSNSKPNP